MALFVVKQYHPGFHSYEPGFATASMKNPEVGECVVRNSGLRR